jgi:hypothetical protein
MKFILSVILLILTSTTSDAQRIYSNFESDSLFKYKFRSEREFRKDYKSWNFRKESKKTYKEYGHYHIGLDQYVFSYHKMGDEFDIKYNIIDFETFGNDEFDIFYIYANNSCGDDIFIKMCYNKDPDDYTCFLSLYYRDPNNGKVIGLYMKFYLR